MIHTLVMFSGLICSVSSGLSHLLLLFNNLQLELQLACGTLDKVVMMPQLEVESVSRKVFAGALDTTWDPLHSVLS